MITYQDSIRAFSQQLLYVPLYEEVRKALFILPLVVGVFLQGLLRLRSRSLQQYIPFLDVENEIAKLRHVQKKQYIILKRYGYGFSWSDI
jgi:hypothetical protein